jgi:hypothetical protein
LTYPIGLLSGLSTGTYIDGWLHPINFSNRRDSVGNAS